MAKTSKTDTEQQPKPDDQQPGDLAGDATIGVDPTETVAALQSQVAELEALVARSESDKEKLEAKAAKLRLERDHARELPESVAALKVGEHIVLPFDGDEESEFEHVVLYRKRSAKPTGRYIPKFHYRFSVLAEDTAAIETLQKQGATIAGGAEGTSIVSVAPNMKPLAAGQRPPAYDIPEDAAKVGLANGWLEEELA
jgi:hypothetical protein